MGTKAELDASSNGGGRMVVALPPTSIHSLSSSEVRKRYLIECRGKAILE